jgi:hypothetical protein
MTGQLTYMLARERVADPQRAADHRRLGRAGTSLIDRGHTLSRPLQPHRNVRPTPSHRRSAANTSPLAYLESQQHQPAPGAQLERSAPPSATSPSTN